MRGSVVYRNLCKVRVIFCREQVASASSSADWGKILRWRSGPVDDWPTVIVVNGRAILDTEQVAAYLAAQAFRPAGAQVGPRPLWLGSRLTPSDEELKDAFWGPHLTPRVRTGSLWRSSGTSGTSCARLPGPSSGAASRTGLPRGLEASNGVTLDVDPAYPSVQPPVLREVLAAQGWPRWLCEAAADFCHARRFSIRWTQFNFRSDTGLPQGPRGLRSCSVLYANHNPFATRVLNSCTWTATPNCRGGVGDCLDCGSELTPVQHGGSGLPPLAGPNIFNTAIAPSLLYGMVQLDTGPTRAGVNSRLVPSRLTSARSSHQGRKCGAEGDITGVEDDSEPWLWWLAGLYPEYLPDRERERWRCRAECCRPTPLQARLARPPYRGWSRLHQAADGLGVQFQREPKRPGVSAWLSLP
ncbi:uncharacterized protein CTHT_0064600 [Thermochaetoides thermophila DSM 1495]|uniref:Uncharacterized protein n=1 Tax=Chaetomium thermophilum (strain DSM 1495 / CBS 144.50 / IMI 039719) TaxID=759272 RepID=G0SG07_CHATD|nr:hypothetical protein CTHT_0064600 [Thermochaetoides thermophila DSM 1495]EGS17146.1 hypothetical protein CTHT_0064600 [Thermochaetoides thermophila DSM 1495]